MTQERSEQSAIQQAQSAAIKDDRPRLTRGGTDPKGHICSKCREREATTAWGHAMTINHGGGEWCCAICALEEQLAFAKERAAAIPELERQLDSAWKGYRS